MITPYTNLVPGGTLNMTQLVHPNAVSIQWPNVSGNTQPTKKTSSFIKSIFG